MLYLLLVICWFIFSCYTLKVGSFKLSYDGGDDNDDNDDNDDDDDYDDVQD